MPESATGYSPLRLSSPSGLRLEANSNGSVRRFDCEAVSLGLFVGNEVEGGPANLYLRRRANPIEWAALLGPSSPTRFHLDAGGRLTGTGTWHGISYSLALVLARDKPVWFWHVHLEASEAQEVDLTYVQDVALASYGAVRLNEFYVAQYLDHTPLRHPQRGTMVATRQNQAVDGRFPWCLIGSLREGLAFATDAKQFHGLATRAGEPPVGLLADLPNRRLQHEHALVVIRDAPINLLPKSPVAAGFFGLYVPDHPEATAPPDVQKAADALGLPEAAPVEIKTRQTRRAAGTDTGVFADTGTLTDTGTLADTATLFSAAPLLRSLDLDTEELRKLFPPPWRHEETDKSGARLSFFHGPDRHVVLRAKELRVLRPHGHILRTGLHTTPDETALTSTVWMSGVFHSMVTQGHVSINRFLSTVHTYLGLFRSHGQRIFAEIGGQWQLLHVPSAFEMAPDACRWIYKHAAGVIQVRAAAEHEPQELTLSVEVLSGEPVRLLVSHHVALNDDDGSAPGAARWHRDGDTIVLVPAPDTDLSRRFPAGRFEIRALPGTQLEQVGGDELLVLDRHSRQQPFLCLVTAPAGATGFTIRGGLVPAEVPPPLRVDASGGLI
ncbi:MAG TPA: hypothetical protein VHB68_18395, partial [Steroidobacteraceae bacterium]|nr:hypothetical protein [Steroidobacteraceae bacterium]